MPQCMCLFDVLGLGLVVHPLLEPDWLHLGCSLALQLRQRCSNIMYIVQSSCIEGEICLRDWGRMTHNACARLDALGYR